MNFGLLQIVEGGLLEGIVSSSNVLLGMGSWIARFGHLQLAIAVLDDLDHLSLPIRVQLELHHVLALLCNPLVKLVELLVERLAPAELLDSRLQGQPFLEACVELEAMREEASRAHRLLEIGEHFVEDCIVFVVLPEEGLNEDARRVGALHEVGEAVIDKDDLRVALHAEADGGFGVVEFVLFVAEVDDVAPIQTKVNVLKQTSSPEGELDVAASAVGPNTDGDVASVQRLEQVRSTGTRDNGEGEAVGLRRL